jgi:hypothetical protein
MIVFFLFLSLAEFTTLTMRRLHQSILSSSLESDFFQVSVGRGHNRYSMREIRKMSEQTLLWLFAGSFGFTFLVFSAVVTQAVKMARYGTQLAAIRSILESHEEREEKMFEEIKRGAEAAQSTVQAEVRTLISHVMALTLEVGKVVGKRIQA